MRIRIVAPTLLTLCLTAWAAGDAAVAPLRGVKAAPLSREVASSIDAITIPQMLSYQGRLTDPLGEPVEDTTYSVEFRLYTAPSGGSPFWSEPQSVKTRGGLFSTLLGSVTPIGSVPDAGTAYLGVSISGGAELSPRLRIVSAAYAYKADTANYALAGAGGGADNAWVRGTPDSVLYTIRNIGIARGGAANMLHGASRYTHVNLGAACTTGVAGQDQASATVGGGYGNAASQQAATVSGGLSNTASGASASVGGGSNNTANATEATVAGGDGNTASGYLSAVGGGQGNDATHQAATVGGGLSNTASGLCAAVGGGLNNAAETTHTTVGGGSGNAATGYAASVGGGQNNTASGFCAAVGGGSGNAADTTYAGVTGGYANNASGYAAAVGGGFANDATGDHSTVAGGSANAADTTYATVGGGSSNNATGYSATVGGGWSNYASGTYSCVPGGRYDTASATYSFAVNGNSDALHSSSAAFNGQATTSANQTRVGVLSKASGSFSIDHPLDPHGKILNHYFIEGPEMLNIYRGSATLDASGRAEVSLPDYFDALNRNPMVQLTGVGTHDVHVAEDVTGSRFTIGGQPGAKVYWQVTGERTDVSAEATRRMMPVEQPKNGALAGRMLDDDFLVGCMDQLLREGRSAGIDFRTAAGRQRYEKMRQ